jgi:ATP-dependent exoDNAse (exonuclease V) beta subunit
MFTHIEKQVHKLERFEDEDGRKYQTPTGEKYPSITTVLGETSDKSALFAWKKRVGEEKAAAISLAATTRGTAMHQLCEDYLSNEPLSDDNVAGNFMFLGIRPALDRIDNVRLLEAPLFSHSLKVAGTVDCIAEIDNELAVIDFKTSKKPKNEEWISDYFMQAAFYFTAYYEMYSEMPKKIAILISVQDGTLQEFYIDGKDVIPWVERLKNRIAMFYNKVEERKNG